MGQSASADCARYLARYPGEPEHDNWTKNIDFYSGRIASEPDGGKIDEIHRQWWGDYQLLEAHHGYIQWLFPIREDGLNHLAQPLQLHEARAIEADTALQDKIIMSYRLMLDFYGMKLKNADARDGEIERADNWRDRYDHLNHSFHNYLRITRILKCLGEVGLEAMKLPFIEFVLKEIFENGQLRNCAESAARFWSGVLRDEDERERIAAYVDKNMGRREEAPRYGGGGGARSYTTGSGYRAGAVVSSSSDDDGFNPYDDGDDAEQLGSGSDGEGGEEAEIDADGGPSNPPAYASSDDEMANTSESATEPSSAAEYAGESRDVSVSESRD